MQVPVHNRRRPAIVSGCLLVAASGLWSCNAKSIGFEVVSIRPIYGWADGCVDVKIGGHGFESGASVTVGGDELANVTEPETATDRGYQLFGTLPAGEAGYADVVVTQPGGESSTLADGYYYVQCPGAPLLEEVRTDGAVAAGSIITLVGCGFDAENMFVQLDEGASIPLTASCGTASVTFEAPDLPADTVAALRVVDADGNDLFPGCSDGGGDTDGDTDADTDVPCEYPTVTYGGAE